MKFQSKDVYIRLIGKEGKSIIFLHGWGQEGSTFLPVIERLKKEYQIYLIDLPGFGKSDEPSYPYQLDDYVELLDQIIDLYQIDDPLVIGHSFGGRIAIRHASQKKRIGKLILVNSAGIKEKRTFRYYYQVYKYKLLKKILSLKPFQKYRERVLSKYGSKDYKNASDMMKKVLINVVNEDLSLDLTQITIPTLLFWGENDTVTPLSSAYKMKELLADSGLVTVKNSGHFSYLDDPYLLAKIIESFH